jgi:hypothetical protein
MAVSTARFSVAERIDAPVERVFHHLSEPASFVGLQPLLLSVEETERGEDPHGRPTRTFRSVERLRLLGFIPYRNTILTRMTLMRPNELIECEVNSPGGVKLRNTFALRAEEGTSCVCDDVTVHCPRWLRPFVVAEARRAHQRMLHNLKRRMEGRR